MSASLEGPSKPFLLPSSPQRARPRPDGPASAANRTSRRKEGTTPACTVSAIAHGPRSHHPASCTSSIPTRYHPRAAASDEARGGSPPQYAQLAASRAVVRPRRSSTWALSALATSARAALRSGTPGGRVNPPGSGSPPAAPAACRGTAWKADLACTLSGSNTSNLSGGFPRSSWDDIGRGQLASCPAAHSSADLLEASSNSAPEISLAEASSPSPRPGVPWSEEPRYQAAAAAMAHGCSRFEARAALWPSQVEALLAANPPVDPAPPPPPLPGKAAAADHPAPLNASASTLGCCVCGLLGLAIGANGSKATGGTGSVFPRAETLPSVYPFSFSIAAESCSKD